MPTGGADINGAPVDPAAQQSAEYDAIAKNIGPMLKQLLKIGEEAGQNAAQEVVNRANKLYDGVHAAFESARTEDKFKDLMEEANSQFMLQKEDLFILSLLFIMAIVGLSLRKSCRTFTKFLMGFFAAFLACTIEPFCIVTTLQNFVKDDQLISVSIGVILVISVIGGLLVALLENLIYGVGGAVLGGLVGAVLKMLIHQQVEATYLTWEAQQQHLFMAGEVILVVLCAIFGGLFAAAMRKSIHHTLRCGLFSIAISSCFMEIVAMIARSQIPGILLTPAAAEAAGADLDPTAAGITSAPWYAPSGNFMTVFSGLTRLRKALFEVTNTVSEENEINLLWKRVLENLPWQENDAQPWYLHTDVWYYVAYVALTLFIVLVSMLAVENDAQSEEEDSDDETKQPIIVHVRQPAGNFRYV